MLSQAEATIYLADQRSCSQQEWHRSYHTFNFGSCIEEDRKSITNLQVVNDDTLKSRSSTTVQVKTNTLIILLPIVGCLHFKSNLNRINVEVGQTYSFFTTNESEFEICNPYKKELINFLQIWLTIESTPELEIHEKLEFDLDANKNRLIHLLSGADLLKSHSAPAYIGKFDGRMEGLYLVRNPKKGCFIFVIEGAFEVENRLLEARDGLSISNILQVTFEALSKNAIILIIEN